MKNTLWHWYDNMGGDDNRNNNRMLRYLIVSFPTSCLLVTFITKEVENVYLVPTKTVISILVWSALKAKLGDDKQLKTVKVLLYPDSYPYELGNLEKLQAFDLNLRGRLP